MLYKLKIQKIILIGTLLVLGDSKMFYCTFANLLDVLTININLELVLMYTNLELVLLYANLELVLLYTNLELVQLYANNS